MTISKNFLINLPSDNTETKTESVLEIKVKTLEDKVEELQEMISVLSKQLDVMAGFEKSLIRAFDEEVDFLDEIRSYTSSSSQKQISTETGTMLIRLKKRWCESVSYKINKEKNKIEKV